MIQSSAQLPDLEETILVSDYMWFACSLANAILGFIMLGAYLLASPSDVSWSLHGLFCVISGLIWGVVLLSGSAGGVGAFIKDHRLVLIASYISYYVIGASFLAFADSFSVEEAISYNIISEHSTLRVDAMNSIGLSVAIFASLTLQSNWIAKLSILPATILARVSPVRVVGLMLTVGCVVSLTVIAVDIGANDQIASGTLRSLGKLAIVAVFIGGSLRGKDAVFIRLSSAIVALVLSTSGLLLFSKSEALLPLFAFALGYTWAHGSKATIVATVAFAVFAFNWLGDLTLIGRDIASRFPSTSLEQRVEILAVSRDLVSAGGYTKHYSGWMRFCYVPSQSSALAMYDSGNGGDGLSLIPWLLIPRFLVPDKPEITKTGREFYVKLTGNDPTSATGQGVFVSGYYHAGWLGWLLASIICGWTVGLTSKLAIVVLRTRAALLIPLPLLGMFTAFRVDGDFVSDFLGPVVFIVYAMLAAWVFMGALRRSGS